jgi:hypothetical protein
MRLLFQRQMALNAQLGQPSALEQFFATQAEPLEEPPEEPTKEPEVEYQPKSKQEPFIPEEGPLQSTPFKPTKPVLQSTAKPRGQAPIAPSAFVEGMVKRGWTPEEAAGTAGNVHAESGFNPGIQERKPIAGRGGYGLIQLTGPRRVAYEQYAADTKRDLADPEAQMDWLNMERTGQSIKYGIDERAAYKRAFGAGGAPDEIAERFGKYVERPANLEASLHTRRQMATRYAPGAEPVPVAKTTPPKGGALPVYADAKGFVFHHSVEPTLEGLKKKLRERGLGSQYLMDRDGTIYSFAGAGSPHIRPNDQFGGIAPGLSNKNAIGMEIVAKDDKDITPAQIASARRFIAENYPDVPVYGHGEVNPGHKQAREGMSVVEAIRAERLAGARPGRTDDEILASVMQSPAG